MTPPQFWKRKNLKSISLLPLSLIYIFIHVLYTSLRTKGKSKLPVICIGNAVVGGSGKTPVAVEIGRILKENGIKFCYLSRGYKRQAPGVIKVRQNHTAEDIGDEPKLLSNIADIYVSENRLIGAKAIENDKADYKAILMDDGLQNPTLKKDLSILVINGKYGFGNEFLLPAGPLREPVSMTLSRVKLVIISGKDEKKIKEKIRIINKKIPIINATLEPQNEKITKDTNKHVYAFSGIAHPKRFFHTLEEMGYEINEYKIFPDHYAFKESDITKIIQHAKKKKLKLITTEKDWVRLSSKNKRLISCLKIGLKFDDEKTIKNAIEKVLKKKVK